MMRDHAVGNFRQACAARGLRFSLEIEEDAVSVHVIAADAPADLLPALASIAPLPAHPVVFDPLFDSTADVLRAA